MNLNIKIMKKITLIFAVLLCTATLLFVSCSTPVGLTSWKNPQASNQISKILVMALFDKLTYSQPFEDQMAAYFTSQNLKSIKSQDVISPTQQHTGAEIQTIVDSLGADGILMISFKGKDVSINSTGGYYGGYRGWYGGGGQVWTTSTFNLRAQLYDVKKDVLLWSADLTVTDPNDITSTAIQVSKAIFADWLKNNLLKNPPPVPQK
jgi:hypothetical protein